MAGYLPSSIILLAHLLAALFILPTASLWVHGGNADSPAKRKPLLHKTLEKSERPAGNVTKDKVEDSVKEKSSPVKGKSMAVKLRKQKLPLEPYRCTSHKPESGKPTRSLILLAPWNGSAGFFDEWLLDDFQKREPKVMKQYRILQCVGRKMPDDTYGYNAWYEYEDWWSETPVAHDVTLATAFVHGLIEKEAAVVGHYEDVVLAGFSQGANLALEAGLTFHSQIGLVFSQRGILLESRLKDETAILQTPYLLTAGADDDTYTEAKVKADCRWLEYMWAPAHMKTFKGLDHYRESKRERTLTVESCAAMLSKGKKDFSQLTEWTDCNEKKATADSFKVLEEGKEQKKENKDKKEKTKKNDRKGKKKHRH